MKKIFIGLLLAGAAGAGVYYFLQNKKTTTANSIQKELLAGQWKLDTLAAAPKDSSAGLMTALISAIDSNFRMYQYDFRQNGMMLLVKDSVTTDTSYYEWNKANDLLWKVSPADSAAETLHVAKLTTDSLVLQTKDSAAFFFSKVK
ncbi:MAG: hypothetical protein JNK14_21555 [Chitinophagaceae bacterium]|nr:hypothetical protein [Chitinophagaceae bacterium]